MAKLVLDLCYKCFGISKEKYEEGTKGLVGGCAITVCDGCASNISNTALVYKRELPFSYKKDFHLIRDETGITDIIVKEHKDYLK